MMDLPPPEVAMEPGAEGGAEGAAQQPGTAADSELPIGQTKTGSAEQPAAQEGQSMVVSTRESFLEAWARFQRERGLDTKVSSGNSLDFIPAALDFILLPAPLGCMAGPTSTFEVCKGSKRAPLRIRARQSQVNCAAGAAVQQARDRPLQAATAGAQGGGLRRGELN
jgi:hypothetical protein